MGVWRETWEDLTGHGEPQRVSAGRVTANAAALLGVEPALGRWLAAGTDRPAAAREVVLSDPFWRSHLGADPDVLGRVLHLNGEPHAIVGIMPAAFVFPLPTTQLWAPRVLDPAEARAGSRRFARWPPSSRSSSFRRCTSVWRSPNRRPRRSSWRWSGSMG